VLVEHGAVVRPLLHAHPQLRAEPLLCDHAEDAAGHPEPEVERRARAQFHRRTPRHDAPFELRWNRGLVLSQRRTPRTAHRFVVREIVELLLLRIDDKGVDHDAGDADVPGGKRARLQHLPDLREDPAAAVVRSKRHRVDVHVDGFAFGTDIAARVGVRPANDRHVDAERLVVQHLASIDGQQVDERFTAAGVAPPAILAWIDERAEPGVREEAWPSRTDLPEQVLDDAAGQAVRLDLLVANQRLHARRPREVGGDHLPQHPLVREAIGAASLAVAQSERVDERELTRMPGLQEASFECRQDGFGGDHPGAVTADGDCLAIADQGGSLVSCHEARMGHERVEYGRATGDVTDYRL